MHNIKVCWNPSGRQCNIQCRQKTSDSHTFVTKKWKNVASIILLGLSSFIYIYIHVEDGFRSLPANFWSIQWKRRFFTIFYDFFSYTYVWHLTIWLLIICLNPARFFNWSSAHLLLGYFFLASNMKHRLF